MKKKNNNIIRTIFVIIILIILITTGVLLKSQSDLKKLTNVEIKNIELSGIDDGEYKGSYKAFPINAEVLVTIKDDAINDIKIIKHINGQGSDAEKITESILKSQSLDVDVVSGATYSSKVIIKAVEDALEKGE